MTVHSTQVDVTFGDCDPAGIVYYPNIYRWIDRCFHDWMRGFGGHAAVCQQIGSAGLGLRDASAVFRRPMRDGDLITVRIDRIEWHEKSLILHSTGANGGARTFTGTETRALFVQTATGITAGAMELLKTVVEGDG